MRIFFAGPLTNLQHPDKTKAFYKKLAALTEKNGIEYFWAFLNGTDPIANPDVPANKVYEVDKGQLEQSDVMVAYVGEPSTGTGMEIEIAKNRGIPVYLIYEKGARVSRMLRGCPAVKGEIVFTDENDGLTQFDALLKKLNTPLS